MRVFVTGQRAFGAAVLRLCRNVGHEVVSACAPLSNSTGDGPDQLRAAAATFGVPCIPAGTLSAATMPDGCDVIVAAHSHDFVGRATRRKARLGAIGYHPSLLPRHRGRDAIAWAIKFNEPVTGGTVYWLNEVMDGGPIAAQDWCWIYPGETAAEVWRRRLFDMGLELFGHVLRDPEAYFANREKQDERLATFEPACCPPRKYRPDLLGLPTPDRDNGVRVVDGWPGYAWRVEPGAPVVRHDGKTWEEVSR